MSQENLSAKFDEVKVEIQNLVAAQQGLQTSLNAISSKLDAVTNAIVGLQGGGNRTLTDLFDKPVTLEGDATIDVTGVEQRLDAVKTALIGTIADPTDVRQAIYNLAGPAPGRSLSDLYAALIGTDGDPTDLRQAVWGLAGPAPGRSLSDLYDQVDSINQWSGYATSQGDVSLLGSFVQLYQKLNDIHGIVGTDTGASSLQTLMTAINNAVGGVPNNSLELATVRGLLNIIQQCACQTAGSLNPQLPVSGCDGIEYRSFGFAVEAYGSQGTMAIATWPEVPAGLVETNGELVPETAWDGWKAYVTSTAQYCALETASTDRYPCNKWFTLTNFSGGLAFAVDEGEGLTVTLCAPVTSSGDCLTFTGTTTKMPISGASGSVYTVLYPTEYQGEHPYRIDIAKLGWSDCYIFVTRQGGNYSGDANFGTWIDGSTNVGAPWQTWIPVGVAVLQVWNGDGPIEIQLCEAIPE